MKNLKLTKPIALLLSGLMLVSTFTVTAAAAETDKGSGNDSSNVGQSISEVMELLNATTYAEYKVTHKEKALGKNAITIAGTDYDTEKTDAKVSVDTYGGEKALYTPELGTVVYNVDVPSDGLYMIEMDYYPIAGKASNIERGLRIDGKIPFKESRYLSMTKIWKDELSDIGESDTAFEQDPLGNDVRPMAIEAPDWATYEFKDATGYYNEPFQYYLTAGTHTLELEATREPVAIGSITLKPYDAPKSYEEVSAETHPRAIRP